LQRRKRQTRNHSVGKGEATDQGKNIIDENKEVIKSHEGGAMGALTISERDGMRHQARKNALPMGFIRTVGAP